MRALQRTSLHLAIEQRTENFQDLVWNRPTENVTFSISVEITLPDDTREQLRTQSAIALRYELEVGEDHRRRPIITRESGHLIHADGQQPILNGISEQEVGTNVFLRTRSGETEYFPEGKHDHSSESSKDLSTQESALASVPCVICHPAAAYALELLTENTRKIEVAVEKLKEPMPLVWDDDDFSGDMFPWDVKVLRDHHYDDFLSWQEHLRTVIPDLKEVRVRVRPEDRRGYVSAEYGDGLYIPSWIMSDGTLRLLEHTLLAYRDGTAGQMFFIEEPDNGVHPLALGAIYESLSSIYEAQVLVSTHSPTFLGLCQPEEALCFGRTVEGEPIVVEGHKHPNLQGWSREMSLLLATGPIEMDGGTAE